jgi:hypothetical protein
MRVLLSVLLVAGLLATGCSQSTGGGASVSGTVTYQGKPVTGGSMFFYGSEKSYPASLDDQGRYTCPDIVPGEYVVTVDNRAIKSLAESEDVMKKMFAKTGGSGQIHSKEDALAKIREQKRKEGGAGGGSTLVYVPIPDKYADKTTSTIKVKVDPGINSKDIALE